MTQTAPAAPATFGEMLKYLRKRARLTQRDLGIAVGYSEAFITRLEGDTRLPDVITVKARFIDALDLNHEPQLAQRLIELAMLSRTAKTVVAMPVAAQRDATLPNNLPKLMPALIGREAMLQEVTNELRQSACHMLVLTGTGGVGKTTLALHAALQCGQSEPTGLALESIVFVDLAPVQHVENIADAITRSLYAVHGHAPARASMDALKEHLRDRALLLVLDNFEQVAAAAPLIAELAAACNSIKFLITSRVALQHTGGISIEVRPLKLDSATALFNLRAHEADPHFAPHAEDDEAIVHLCQKLDGLPLAIELVAARVKLMTPQQLLARLTGPGGRLQMDLVADGLSNLPARQRTLRNTIAWSYNLLTPVEQMVLRRLSIFSGGCTLPAAEAVLIDDASNPDTTIEIWNALTSLMNKNLLKQEAGENGSLRFILLETVREFAQMHIHEEEARAMGRLHAGFFFALALEAEPHINSPAPALWLNILARDQDNIRVAMQWQLDHDASSMLRFCVALGAFWHSRGFWREGRQMLLAALEKTKLAAPSQPTAGALYWLGRIHRRLNDWQSALQCGLESVALYRALDDDHALAEAISALGWATYSVVGWSEAGQCFEEALEIHRRLGDSRGIAQALLDLSLIAEHYNDYALSKQYLLESRARFKQVGDDVGIGLVNGGLATLACLNGEYAQCRELLAEGLNIFKRVGEVGFFAGFELEMGEVCYFLGDYEAAGAALAESFRLHREMAGYSALARTQYHMARLCRCAGDVAGAKAHLVDALVTFQNLQRSHMIARCVAALGGIALMEGKATMGATLLGAAQQYFDHQPRFLAPAD